MRAPFTTADGATVLMHYTSLVEQTPLFKAAAEADRPTSRSDQYMRLMIRFDTGSSAYRWLNTSLCIARGRLLGKTTSSEALLASGTSAGLCPHKAPKSGFMDQL